MDVQSKIQKTEEKPLTKFVGLHLKYYLVHMTWAILKTYLIL